MSPLAPLAAGRPHTGIMDFVGSHPVIPPSSRVPRPTPQPDPALDIVGTIGTMLPLVATLHDWDDPRLRPIRYPDAANWLSGPRCDLRTGVTIWPDQSVDGLRPPWYDPWLGALDEPATVRGGTRVRNDAR